MREGIGPADCNGEQRRDPAGLALHCKVFEVHFRHLPKRRLMSHADHKLPAQSKDRLLLLTVLGLSSMLAMAMLAFRSWWTGQRTYGFFAWNLFLAWLPLVFISLAVSLRPGRFRRPLAIGL